MMGGEGCGVDADYVCACVEASGVARLWVIVVGWRCGAGACVDEV